MYKRAQHHLDLMNLKAARPLFTDEQGPSGPIDAPQPRPSCHKEASQGHAAVAACLSLHLCVEARRPDPSFERQVCSRRLREVRSLSFISPVLKGNRNGSKKSRRSPTTDALEFFGDGFVHWQATLLCMSTYIREPSSVKTVRSLIAIGRSAHRQQNLRNILIENTTLAGLADAAELSGKISPPVGAPPRLEKARANSFECHLGGLLLDGRREEAANWVEDVFRVLAKHVVGGPLERGAFRSPRWAALTCEQSITTTRLSKSSTRRPFASGRCCSGRPIETRSRAGASTIRSAWKERAIRTIWHVRSNCTLCTLHLRRDHPLTSGLPEVSFGLRAKRASRLGIP